MVIEEDWEIRLDQYLLKELPSGDEIIEIFQDVLKAAYSLASAGIFPTNLRAEHFVRARDTWKLDTIVFEE